MTLSRFIALAVALAGASTLIACTTAPAMPTGAAPAANMASPERMAAMAAQMKTMHDMHTKMGNARTPEERQALMPEHKKAMQGGMVAMKGMGGMSGMDPKAMPPEMAQRHKMMMQHMEMMQTMMDMMQQRMPASPAKQ